MATISGSIDGISLLQSNVSGLANGKAYLLSVSFPAYTGSTDDMKIAGVGAAIAAHTKSGVTPTLVGGICLNPGIDTNGQKVWAGALTVSTDDLTGNLVISDRSTEITTSTACSGVQVVVIVDE